MHSHNTILVTLSILYSFIIITKADLYVGGCMLKEKEECIPCFTPRVNQVSHT